VVVVFKKKDFRRRSKVEVKSTKRGKKKRKDKGGMKITKTGMKYTNSWRGGGAAKRHTREGGTGTTLAPRGEN